MSKSINDAMRESTAVALEMLAFLMLEPAQESNESEEFGVSISFTGERAVGEMQIWAPEELLVYMASNILGDGERDSLLASGKETLKEVLNIAAGQFLTEYYGPEFLFDLGLPKEVHTVGNLSYKEFLESIETETTLKVLLGEGNAK